jgi:protein translocase SecG subunit
MVKTTLLVLQVILAIGLVVFVLLQQKGSGVGGVFGGESVVYRSRRGVERILHYATIAFAVLLCLISLYTVLLNAN